MFLVIFNVYSKFQAVINFVTVQYLMCLHELNWWQRPGK